MNKRTGQMKKYVFANIIFIIFQIILLILSIVFNFLFGDTTVFLTVFLHVGVFVIYNAVTESIIEYRYLRKKYSRICDETHYLRYFQLKKRIYKASKSKKDTVSSALILQSAIKSFLVIINILSLLFVITFE